MKKRGYVQYVEGAARLKRWELRGRLEIKLEAVR